ncbi:hypothetical protein HC256_000478 [Beauveria bassiana]|nr:hypothetical protein HC256_000478 [Beauveria bassiana]
MLLKRDNTGCQYKRRWGSQAQARLRMRCSAIQISMIARRITIRSFIIVDYIRQKTPESTLIGKTFITCTATMLTPSQRDNLPPGISLLPQDDFVDMLNIVIYYVYYFDGG